MDAWLQSSVKGSQAQERVELPGEQREILSDHISIAKEDALMFDADLVADFVVDEVRVGEGEGLSVSGRGLAKERLVEAGVTEDAGFEVG